MRETLKSDLFEISSDTKDARRRQTGLNYGSFHFAKAIKAGF